MVGVSVIVGVVVIEGVTDGVKSHWLRKILKPTLERWAPRVDDPFPASLSQKANLIDLPTALSQMHFPDNQEILLMILTN